MRAAVESLAFRVYQMCQLMYQETGQVVRKMRVDGGVCRNDFLMQLISDLTMVTIDRPVFTETASQGAAMMAGLQLGEFISISNVIIMLMCYFIFKGIWKSRNELKSMRQTERVFTPVENRW